MLCIDIPHTYQNHWYDRYSISCDLICLILAYKIVETRFLSMQSPDHLPFENRNVVKKKVLCILYHLKVYFLLNEFFIYFPISYSYKSVCRFCNILKYLFWCLPYFVRFSEVLIGCHVIWNFALFYNSRIVFLLIINVFVNVFCKCLIYIIL